MVSDDVADAEAVGGDRPEPEALEAGVTAVGGAQDVVLHGSPGLVAEDGWELQLVLVPLVPEAVERIQVTVLAEPLGAFPCDLRVRRTGVVQELNFGGVRGILVQ